MAGEDESERETKDNVLVCERYTEIYMNQVKCLPVVQVLPHHHHSKAEFLEMKVQTLGKNLFLNPCAPLLISFINLFPFFFF